MMEDNMHTKLFLLDPNLFNLELNLRYLQLVGYKNISTFKTIEDCKLSLADNPQIIIIDKNTIGSIDFIKDIKRKNADIYIIVLIGSSELNEGKKCIEVGAFDYIIKDEETVSKIKFVLNRIHSVIEILETNKFTPKQKIFRLITFI
jgi:response regulator RpfG family c-di-GMP phosphodiesterase